MVGRLARAHRAKPFARELRRALIELTVARDRETAPRSGDELPDRLADVIEATLPPRIAVAGAERDPEARLFPGITGDQLRTALGRACRSAGVPVFSPHDLRHRRISVLHRQGRTFAEIAQFVGQKKLSVTADTYTHVLVDSREVDLAGLLSSG